MCNVQLQAMSRGGFGLLSVNHSNRHRLLRKAVDDYLSITSSIFVLLFMSLARSQYIHRNCQQPHTQSEYAATKAAGCWLVSLTIMAIRHVDLAEATTQQCMATILLIVLPKAADDDSLRTPWQYRTRVLEYPGINMATRVRYWYSSTCAGTIR